MMDCAVGIEYLFHKCKLNSCILNTDYYLANILEYLVLHLNWYLRIILFHNLNNLFEFSDTFLFIWMNKHISKINFQEVSCK